jgi:predicted phosphodiesterase
MVIHTGDVVYKMDENTSPYEAYTRKYYAIFSPLLHTMPVYTVVGNHDVEKATRLDGIPFYYYAFPPPEFPLPVISETEGHNQWYAVAWNNIQFLMLDTQVFFGEQGRNEQDAWLSERLSDENFAQTIPVFHVPMYSDGIYPSDGLSIRASWQELFETANVPLVLSGHDHNYQRFLINDITYIISGGGSSVLYAQQSTKSGSMFFARQMHFVILEIYQDRIELKAIARGGETLEQAIIPLDKSH